MPETSIYSLSAADQTNVRRSVLASLKDPESARFGSMAASKATDGTIFVCGFVNARNSFGGYTGMEPFAGRMTGPAFGVVYWGNTRPMYDYVLSECRKFGVPI